MAMLRPNLAVYRLAVLLGVALAGTATAEIEPGELLVRMAAAVQNTSYQGTVVRIREGEVEALKVVHAIQDGVVHEKVVAQEGEGLEIVRIGSEVHCISPVKESVLVEKWDDQSTLFSTLPKSEVRFGSEYDLAIVREDRVAGRETVMLAIRPHDELRYGHRIWLDRETSFPLQARLIDENGRTIEQVTFADIAMNSEIAASSLASSYSTEDFTWLRQSTGHAGRSIDTNWASDELPAGFRPVSTHEEKLDGSDNVVTHIMYSDGLANVSVFIAADGGHFGQGASRVGDSNAYSVIDDGHEITAIGRVPAATVRQIATTMYRAEPPE